jgi:hypothetical protein
VSRQPPPAPTSRGGEGTERAADDSGGERLRRPRHGPLAPPALRCRIRLADGRTFCGELEPERHRALHLGLLHAASDGLVELTPGTRPPGGKVEIDRRTRCEHYLPGGASGSPGWLERLLEHARRIAAGEFTRARFDGQPREEAFVGVTPRTKPRGTKDAVAYTRWLWVDVDRPEQLPALWALLAERPCHLLIETAGGSGRVHAYWKLDRPLEAVRVNERTHGAIEVIERANARLIHCLGVDADGRPAVADPVCRKRSQPMRLAGTVNWKTGRYARIVEADLQMTPYSPEALVGDLPDPPWAIGHHAVRVAAGGSERDPYKRIPPPVYFEALAGITVPPTGGRVRCPVAAHEDRHPSCDVSSRPETGWYCRSCEAGGAIYDLASVLLGGPHGRQLRGEQFNNARAYVADIFGELT